MGEFIHAVVDMSMPWEDSLTGMVEMSFQVALRLYTAGRAGSVSVLPLRREM
jgi:hypothetical protein